MENKEVIRVIVIPKQKYGFFDGAWDILIGKVYDAIEEDEDWYRIVDESGEDYIYPKTMFNIVE